MKKTQALRIGILLAFVLSAMVMAGAPAVADSPPPAGTDTSWDVQFSGVIAAVGAAGQAWQIGGQTVATDGSTNIVLTVRLAEVGQWADVRAREYQADGSLLARQIIVRPERVRLRGVVTSKPTGLAGDWIISGVPVKVTDATKVRTNGAPVDVGCWVEAVMTESGGVLTATHLLEIGGQDAVMIHGEIQDIQDTEWLVSGIRLAVNAADPDRTLISGTPAVGLLVQAAAQPQNDNTLAVKALRVLWTDRRAPSVADFTGTIEALPEYGLRGLWTVAGQQVLVTTNALIHREKGLPVVGATVHVRGWQATDKVIAMEITVISSPVEGGEYTQLDGIIEHLPDRGIKGIWIVAGNQVMVDECVLLLGTMPEVGKAARVEGVKRASDGLIIASTIFVRALDAPPTWTPPAIPIGTRTPTPQP